VQERLLLLFLGTLRRRWRRRQHRKVLLLQVEGSQVAAADVRSRPAIAGAGRPVEKLQPGLLRPLGSLLQLLQQLCSTLLYRFLKINKHVKFRTHPLFSSLPHASVSPLWKVNKDSDQN